jgi:MOSC domain-containing protein
MKLAAIFVYPIKSCAGIAVTRASLTRRGLLHDRRWMVVDDSGRFLTQRTLPAMALVRTTLHEHGVRVERATMTPLELPFTFSNGAHVEIDVWLHHGPAVRHVEGSAWFSRALARPAQLVCLPDELVRPVRSEAAQPGDEVSFADGFPLLVASVASLDDLNARSGLRTDVRRFRPNLVIEGAPPWAEDDWHRLRVGGLALRLPTACARCSIPSLDPDTAVATPEPLRTLATFRRRGHEVFFGVNAIPDEVGELAIGDAVEVIG